MPATSTANIDGTLKVPGSQIGDGLARAMGLLALEVKEGLASKGMTEGNISAGASSVSENNKATPSFAKMNVYVEICSATKLSSYSLCLSIVLARHRMLFRSL